MIWVDLLLRTDFARSGAGTVVGQRTDEDWATLKRSMTLKIGGDGTMVPTRAARRSHAQSFTFHRDAGDAEEIVDLNSRISFAE